LKKEKKASSPSKFPPEEFIPPFIKRKYHPMFQKTFFLIFSTLFQNLQKTHCLKIIQIVAFEFLNYFLSFLMNFCSLKV